MEIKLSNLQTDAFDVRDGSDEDNYELLKGSLSKDGQWDPIIVRPSQNGSNEYQVIAGHTRCKAAFDLGWETIDAKVKDVDDAKADELSLKTNLVRSDMSKVEQGKVLNHMLNEYEITQTDLADRIGKSKSWVGNRVRIALDLHEDVQKMVEDGKLSFTVAQMLSGVDKSEQADLAKRCFEESINSRGGVAELKRRYFNDTLYTIGYEGRDWDEFVSLLQENDIEVLLDVRASASSQYKPEFSGDRMGEALGEESIEYRHIPELGVSYDIRQPYKAGYLGDECFANWYEWSVTENEEYDIAELADEVEQTGAPALLCYEAHAEPGDGQDIHCHRDFLAEYIAAVTDDDRPLFPNRVDL